MRRSIVLFGSKIVRLGTPSAYFWNYLSPGKVWTGSCKKCKTSISNKSSRFSQKVRYNRNNNRTSPQLRSLITRKNRKKQNSIVYTKLQRFNYYSWYPSSKSSNISSSKITAWLNNLSSKKKWPSILKTRSMKPTKDCKVPLATILNSSNNSTLKSRRSRD